MAYSFVDLLDTAAAASTTTIALSRTVAVGDNLVVLLEYDAGSGTATVGDTLGNTYTQLDALDDTSGGTFVSVRLYYCTVTIGGTTTITATMDSARANRILGVWKYQGLSGTPVKTAGVEQNPAPTTTDGVKPSNGTPAAQPAMVFGVSVNYTGRSGATLLAGTGITSRGNLTNGDTIVGAISASGDKRVTSTAATAVTFTNNTATQQINTMGLIWAESSGSSSTATPPAATGTLSASAPTVVRGSVLTPLVARRRADPAELPLAA